MKSLPKGIKAPSTERILDIGCGDNCLDIATHLVDLYPDSDQERDGPLELPSDKEFKQGSIEKIPYPDKFFGYAHSAHILEHSPYPDQAIAELERVASAGYIETPAAGVEQGSHFHSGKGGWDFHKHFVWNFPDRKKIYIREKTPTSMKSICPCSYGRRFRTVLECREVHEFYGELPYSCVMTLHPWHGTINYQIMNETENGLDDPHWGCTCLSSAFYHHCQVYLKSLRHLRRRFKFKRNFRKVYQLLSNPI